MLEVSKIWILGNKHPHADKSILWDEPFPNLGDPDVLIVDLTPLTKEILDRTDKDKLNQLSSTLCDKFLHGGTIIVLTPSKPLSASYSFLPVVPYFLFVPDGFNIKPDLDHYFMSYLKAVKKFTFYIQRFDSDPINFSLNSDYIGPNTSCSPVSDQAVTDNSGHCLGATFSIFIQEKGVMTRVKESGKLVFLPPYTESSDDALEKIICRYRPTSVNKEPEPQWATNVSLPSLNDIQSKIDTLESKKKELQAQSNALTKEKQILLGHKRLLYSKHSELEDAVANAFKVLGFQEIRKLREQNFEDWVFDFKHEKDVKYGVIEVKGADKRTKQNDIIQCSKWVDERMEIDNKISKGIFVPNQYCQMPYPESSKDRKKFESNELGAARMKRICIIPSYVLFEAVKQILENKKYDRKEIEKKIFNSEGVLETLL